LKHCGVGPVSVHDDSQDSELSPPAFRNLHSYSHLDTCGLRQKDSFLNMPSNSCCWCGLGTYAQPDLLQFHREKSEPITSVYGPLRPTVWSYAHIAMRHGTPQCTECRSLPGAPAAIEYRPTGSDQGRLVGLPLPTARTRPKKCRRRIRMGSAPTTCFALGKIDLNTNLSIPRRWHYRANPVGQSGNRC